MRLTSLVLKNFRNYIDEKVLFDSQLVIIHGKNGQGKTNLLEAIYITALGQSFRQRFDRDLINFNEKSDSFKIEANYIDWLDQKHNVELSLDRKSKKKLLFDSLEETRLRDHLGRVPIVLLKPNDLALTYGSPSERRKFIDILISQLSTRYLDNLYELRRIIKQKNALLKQSEKPDLSLLQIWNKQLTNVSVFIIKKRLETIELLNEEITLLYEKIADEKVNIEIKYKSNISLTGVSLEDLVEEKLDQSLENEIRFKQSIIGPHRDDLQFKLNGKIIGEFGSQGENKSYIIVLKLAEMILLKKFRKENAILLLDDIFSELDQDRKLKLIEMIKEKGQTFITSTESELFENQTAQLISIDNGKICVS
jgi:DNA replication and repair protein RecF